VTKEAFHFLIISFSDHPILMTRNELIATIKRKRSLLCVGLDTEAHLVPAHFREESHPVRAFNEAIVEATHDVAVAYKLNLAFYEALGVEGWEDLEATVAYIRSRGDCFIIADAKRGDIGNTARKYVEAFYDTLGFDAVTMGDVDGDGTDDLLITSGWSAVRGFHSGRVFLLSSGVRKKAAS
jgi:orotidine-5'-phosphate decarboxylase